MFPIKDKVALVTGASSGIGLCYVKELLRNGLRGVTIADIDTVKGEQAIKEITQEFGANKTIFIKTDVTVQKEVEAAFKKTVEVYKNLDIVVNNAGVMNDSIWEKEIAINLNGTIHGCLLAWDYLQKYRSGTEGVIVNVASITGLTSFMSIPIYSATKHAIVGLSKGMGTKAHYDRTKIRVVTICPGVTDTKLISGFVTNYCLPAWEATYKIDLPRWPTQQPDIVAKGFIQAITTGTTGSYWVINNSKIQNIPHLPEVLELPK